MPPRIGICAQHQRDASELCQGCWDAAKALGLSFGKYMTHVTNSIPTDERMLAIGRKVAELAGPGAEFFVAVAFPNRPGIASLSNMPATVQPEFLRLILESFDEGKATLTEPVPVTIERPGNG